MADIVMPRLSDTMEEGTILRWLKRDGEKVHRGEELVEIETDKATMSYESDQEGVLQAVAGEGDTLAVGALIAHVDSMQDEGLADGRASVPDSAAHPDGKDDGPASGPADMSTAGGAPAHASSQPAPTSSDARSGRVATGSRRVRASPLARRLARENAVDLQSLTGTGPGGRIVKTDVEAASARADAARPGARPDSAQAPSPAGVATAKGAATAVELSRSQQTIARRMAESKATIPDFTLQTEVRMDECVKLRAQLKGLSQPDPPTYNDMVVKACALALREHPRANSTYRDGKLQLHSRVNVGVAVAVDEPPRPGPRGGSGGTLIVPTIFDADAKSLGEIARETRVLAAREREASITPPELGGGTFTVSNLGMFAVTSFVAIINPPQVAILSVGSVDQRAVVQDEQVVAGHTMTITLACDHRVLYGADAARLIARVRELLEQPAALTL
jgi:pyruvate dehydrogenase E2 component (dihydrolipoamide acetyltransferase)